MPTFQTEQGFSLTKLAVLMAILVPLTIVATVAFDTDETASQRQDPALAKKLRSALHRLADELRTASATGEDSNGNQTLDDGEDRNDNGRLDADWEVTAHSITFNRVLPNGTFSLPITYRVRKHNLERVVTLTSSGRTRATILAANVARFDLQADGNKLTIDLAIVGPADQGVTQAASVTVVRRG